METRIITISREFGSGGRTIGKETAAKLGIPCYDQALVEKLVKESGFSREYIKERGEYTSHGSWLGAAVAGRDFNGHSYQDDLWHVQQRVIRELAEQGPCVIVGRCADYILRDREDVLRVFIHADLAQRAKRIVEQYGERPEAPEKRLRDKDKRRAAYYQFYTDMKWGAARNYHVSLDSGALGIPRCVELLTELYQAGSRCPLCDNHCPKDALNCPRGREHFGVPAPQAPTAPDTPDGRVLLLLRKCGHYLHHSAGETPPVLPDSLSAAEKETLTALLTRCLDGWTSAPGR